MRLTVATALGAGAALFTTALFKESHRLRRRNFRGRDVTLAQGIGTAVGATIHTASVGDRCGAGFVAVSGGLGLLDDLDRDPSAHRGFRGHLHALRQGTITTGLLKLAGIGIAATATAWSHAGRATLGARLFDTGVNTVVLAGSANLINLLDLRPGRGLKATTALAIVPALIAINPHAVGAIVQSVVAAPGDLTERSMLGDAGANSLGALVGLAVVETAGRSGRILVASSLLGLTLASEKVSFSAVIERTPVLRLIDQAGRR